MEKTCFVLKKKIFFQLNFSNKSHEGIFIDSYLSDLYLQIPRIYINLIMVYVYTHIRTKAI